MLQHVSIEVAADQHQLVFHAAAPIARIEGEALADQVENVTLVALRDPKQPLGAEDTLRESFQEALEPVDGEGPVAPKRERRKAFRCRVIVPMVVSAFAPVALVIAVRLKQADAQDQRKRHLAARGAHDARMLRDDADLLRDGIHIMRGDEVALVEQNDVAVDELVACRRALEQVEAEACGVGHRNDRVEPDAIAEFGAQEGQHDRQRVGEAGGLDHQVVDLAGEPQDAAQRVDEIVVDRAADAAVAQLDHVGIGGDDQLVVDADVAELVDDDRGAHALLAGQDVIEQRGFAAAEEASDDSRGQALVGKSHGIACNMLRRWVRATGGGPRRRCSECRRPTG